MTDRRLHIVCFDIPYPATYGGAIDVYYRIRALKEAGVKITLHCTCKGEPVHYPELENLCEKVFYYPRKIALSGILSPLPLAVVGRPNEAILQNLLQDDAPILYEGLVSCGTIMAPELKERRKFFRECNVEHDYYRALAGASKNLQDRVYYKLEAGRLERFEKVLTHADGIFALARHDEEHFRQAFPMVETTYIPCFHAHSGVACPQGAGHGILYHGNLRVEENRKAAEYILREIAPALRDIPFTIAGTNADTLKAYSDNVTIVNNPDEEQMRRLMQDAQIHLLVTFQTTGLKLKLLNALYEGRHVVCNPEMVCGTELGELCHIGEDAEQLIDACRRCYSLPFSCEDLDLRSRKLQPFDNKKLTEILLKNVFSE